MTDEVLVTGTDTNEPGVTANADGATGSTGETKPQGDVAAKTDDKDIKPGDKPAEVPEKYEFAVPEGMVLDEAKATEFTEIAKELKLSQDGANKLVAMFVKSEQGRAEAHRTTVQEWISEVKADKDIGGDKLKETVATANKAVDLGPPELKAFLKDSGLGNHPLLVKWAHSIGKALSQDKLVPANTPAAGEKSLAQKMYPNHPQ